MLSEIKPAILIALIFTAIAGLVYPAAITGLSQVMFSHQANGSLITANGKVIRVQLDRTEFLQAGVFSSATLGGGRQGLRRDGFGRLQLIS